MREIPYGFFKGLKDISRVYDFYVIYLIHLQLISRAMSRKRLGVHLIQIFISTELQANEFVVSILY